MITTITRADLDGVEQLVSARDLREEIEQALRDGRETTIQHISIYGREFVYFPESRRGAVWEGGDPEWTAASSLEDLRDRWANYEDRWSH